MQWQLWQQLTECFFKINVDGAWRKESGDGCFGAMIRDSRGSFVGDIMGKLSWCMIRDSRGSFVGAIMGKLSWCASPAVIEAMAIRSGILLGSQLGLTSVVVESDAKAVINMINGQIVTSQELGVLIHDVQALGRSFQVCSFSFACRSCNMVG